MHQITCAACGYEFEAPSIGPSGPCCPRCAEPVSPSGGRAPVVSMETYVGAALGGAALGLLVAAALVLSRW